MMSTVLEVIENKNIDLTAKNCYAAIIGASPSKGAKSPVLWNAAFEKLNISGVMRPMDVLPERLESVVQCLRADKKFIGGAVTMPFKIEILPFLDELEPEAAIIGAVNCIYRQGDKLIGTNTDGAGAIWSLQQAFGGPITGRTVLLLGTGGAGLAVASYIAFALENSGKLLIANRTKDSRDVIAQKLEKQCQVQNIDQWPIEPGSIKSIDILVNCTSIGFETLKQDDRGAYTLKHFSPLGPVGELARVPVNEQADEAFLKKEFKSIEKNTKQSLNVLSKLGKPFVFDIIYQPEETVLLNSSKSVGCKILNGLPMNLEQAVIAFVKATGLSGLFDGSTEQVRSIMNDV